MEIAEGAILVENNSLKTCITYYQPVASVRNLANVGVE
jgi:hypothetical protein